MAVFGRFCTALRLEDAQAISKAARMPRGPMDRNLSKKKLNFISIPSAFTKITGKKHWLTLLRARAIENFCYILAPAQFGKNNKYRETFGHTAIISPDGEILKIKKKGTGIIIADIDPSLSIKLRKIIPSIN